MTTVETYPAWGINLVLLLGVVLVVLAVAGAAVIWLVVRLTRRKNNGKSLPPPVVPAAKRLCPQCGKEMSVDAPQGLCPACLMQVALGTKAGDAARPESPKSPPPAPGELAARFPHLEILELLGHGGMGAVYKARQKQLDRLVALKVLPAHSASDAGFTERFNREARALAKLSHPNIVGVYEYGQADGVPFFIMEYVDGLNLRQMQQAGKLEPREALKIIPQICEALQFAHDEGIVHRDIKPENVLLDKKGRVKIADFGLARILGREPSAFRLTGARDIMGTPHYMAPEQIEKPQTVDHRADIYSLGVVFYEILTGELPLGRFAPPSQKVQVDVRLDEVVLRTLEKEPERRYQHASDVKTQVETIANHPHAGAAPAVVQPAWARGMDFKSKRTLFGLPLVHIATGLDPATGRTRIARGIIAIGGVAQGVFAFGGVAMGGFAFGGLSIGIFAYGGLALGLLALGGLGIGLLAASGGLAIAPIALGAEAIGYLAHGAHGIGPHVLDNLSGDPLAERFFLPWARNWASNMQVVNFALLALTIILVTILPPWVRRITERHPSSTGAPRRGWAFLFATLILLLAVAVALGVLIKKPSKKFEEVEEGTALFCPVIDPSLGDSSYRLISVLAKPRQIALGVVQFVDERNSVSIKIPQLGFYLVSPDRSNTVAAGLTWSLEKINEGQGAWRVHLTGECSLQRFGQTLRLAGDKPFLTNSASQNDPEQGPLLNLDPSTTTWKWVRAGRSHWVGPGEWSKREWNTLPLFEARDQQNQVVGRLQVKLLACPLLREANASWASPRFFCGDWESDANVKELVGELPSIPVAIAASRASSGTAAAKVAELKFRLVAAEGDTNSPADELADAGDRTGQAKLRVLKEVLLDGTAVSSACLHTNAPPSSTKTINLTLKESAAEKFATITTANLHRRLAIVWRGRVLSAPTIASPITAGKVSIAGNLSDAEALVLVELLNFNSSGASAAAETIIERTVTLGEVGHGGVVFVNLEKAELQPSPFYIEVDPSDPDLFKHNSRIDEWIAASGADLALHLKQTNWAFAALGTRMIFMKEQKLLLEETTKKNADALLTNEQARKESGSYPSYGAGVAAYPVSINYAFKTRGGTVGFLEIGGFTNNGNGLKLRYRLFEAKSH